MAQETKIIEELPLDGAGLRLRRAREAAGLDLAAVSATTRIPERHLAAIERGEFAALPARTYALGFSRAYAKAVRLDDSEILDQVRAELAGLDGPQPRGNQSFEPGDPARVPGQRLAWLSALAVLVMVVALFFAWRSFYAPAASLPPLVEDAPVAAAPANPPAAGAVSAPASGSTVVTSRGDLVWVLITDASGNQVFQKEMIRGESFAVPPETQGAKLSTARPEEIEVTVGGQPLAALAGVRGVVREVPLSPQLPGASAPESTVSR